jgi:OTU domain-containing protein 6
MSQIISTDHDLSYGFRMPITVIMHDTNSNNLKIIAEYGQEYGKEKPIRVIYDGFGHYDVLKCST